jgi:hypothetical protein
MIWQDRMRIAGLTPVPHFLAVTRANTRELPEPLATQPSSEMATDSQL